MIIRLIPNVNWITFIIVDYKLYRIYNIQVKKIYFYGKEWC